MPRQNPNKFYIMSEDITKNPNGMVIVNENDLKQPGVTSFMPIDTRIRGFSHLVQSMRPILRYDRKKGRLPKDLETYQGCWLITQALKDVFESVDHSAFEFIKCDIVVDGRVEQSEFWLCDVVRVVNCINEEKSKMFVHVSGNRKGYFILSNDIFCIDIEFIGQYKIFRPQFGEDYVICSQSVRDFSKDKKIKGISYTNVVVA